MGGAWDSIQGVLTLLLVFIGLFAAAELLGISGTTYVDSLINWISWSF